MNLYGLQRGALYFHTIRHLRPIQIVNRLQRRVFKPKIKDIPAREMPCATFARHPRQHIMRHNDVFKDGVVKFLNAKDDFYFHRWGTYQKPLLWHYNLHYFNFLRSSKPSSNQSKIIESWIAEVESGSPIAWDPYPISLRAINWIHWHLHRRVIDKAGLSEVALKSLRSQLYWLSQSVEWHLLGNHVFENGKSLLIGGLFFDGYHANKLRDQGIKILNAAINEQILSDGAHFELSPMYHALILEGLLEIVSVASIYPQRQTEKTIELLNKINIIVPKMFRWLAWMTHRDGDFAFFNDTALGVAPKLAELVSYATDIGYSVSLDTTNMIYPTESGYCRLEKMDAVAIIDFADVGPDYLPGHAHADTLSFEFSLGSDRVFVNSGTSVYQAGPLRSFQRSTAAHNTVEILGENSSEVWGGFRVARRAKVYSVKMKSIENSVFAEASHDGYRRLKKPVVHKRQFKLSDKSLVITDSLDQFIGATVRFYLHPNCEVVATDADNKFKIMYGKDYKKELSLQIKNCDVEVIGTCWYPEFGIEVKNQCIVLKPKGQNCRVKLDW